MKVTEPEVIGALEEELIEAVKGSLDLEKVGELIRERFSVSGLTCKNGDIVVHGGKVAYRLDLSLTVDLTVLMDRSGNHIPDTPREKEPLPDKPGPGQSESSDLSEILRENRNFWEERRMKAISENLTRSGTR